MEYKIFVNITSSHPGLIARSDCLKRHLARMGLTLNEIVDDDLGHVKLPFIGLFCGLYSGDSAEKVKDAVFANLVEVYSAVEADVGYTRFSTLVIVVGEGSSWGFKEGPRYRALK